MIQPRLLVKPEWNSGWENGKSSRTSRKVRSMQLQRRPKNNLMGACMKTSKALIPQRWRNHWPIRLTRWSFPVAQFKSFKSFLRTCCSPNPTLSLQLHCPVLRLCPQMFGSPSARPRDYRLTWSKDYTWIMDPWMITTNSGKFSFMNGFDFQQFQHWFYFYEWSISNSFNIGFLGWDELGDSGFAPSLRLKDQSPLDSWLLCRGPTWTNPRAIEGRGYASQVPDLSQKSIFCEQLCFCFKLCSFHFSTCVEVNGMEFEHVSKFVSWKSSFWPQPKCQKWPWSNWAPTWRITYACHLINAFVVSQLY